MSSAGGQFVLLLWKNFVLQKRKICVTVFEILVPVFFALLLLLIRAIASSEYIKDDSQWDRVYPGMQSLPKLKVGIHYTPSNTETDALIDTVASALNTTKRGFASESALIDDWNTNSSSVNLWAAVVFSGDFSSGLPNVVDYKLRVALREGQESDDRWRTANTYALFAPFGYRNNDSTGGEPWYWDTGFLTLQYQLNKAIILSKSATTVLNSSGIDVSLKKMLYPPFLQDVLTTVLQTNLPLFLVLSFILNALQISKNIAYEKEKKLKEAMKMMGLSTFMYWLSWFVKCLIYLVVVIIIYTIIFSINVPDKGKIINYVNPIIFFLFLLCYILATIAFCFMISTFFSKANTAAFVCGILFFLSYFPYFFLSSRYETMSRSEKMAAGLLHNVAMAFGCVSLIVYEGTGEGAQWSNFYAPATVDDNFALIDAMAMLLVDTVLYMVIAWYVDNINPGDAGVAQPPWFLFMVGAQRKGSNSVRRLVTCGSFIWIGLVFIGFSIEPSYWCGSKVDAKDDASQESTGNDPAHFERDPDAKIGIKIQNLSKAFKSKVAVKGTSLNMFEGQITSLLGHNGAGKTTTISMLTGFLEPSGGTAVINGYDIRTDISNVRKTLGLCPQHNILFDLLTVKEHLEFFAKLKGCKRKDVAGEVQEMIKVLGLEGKANALSATLSGGQKRKLSVGIALIANSKTVILDEPTSGMDPAARRQTWDILQKYREGRTIILTTHFMDEADILGDRIAIMSDGVVKCCGTSMFLKKLYGAGYHLVMVKGPSCNVEKLTSVIKSHISTASLESEISQEIKYLLPFEESDKFERLFTDVESKMKELGVNSFGTSATTMEEVFLKVGEGSEDEENGLIVNEKANGFSNPGYGSMGNKPKEAFVETSNEKMSNYNKLPPISPHTQNGMDNPGYDYASGSVDTVIPMDDVNNGKYIEFNKQVLKNTGFALVWQQFSGMVIKKFIHARRNLAVAAAQLILPVIFAMMALAVEKTIPSVGDEPALKLDLAPFSEPVSTYSDGLVSTADTVAFATAYKSQFERSGDIDRSMFATMDAYFKAQQDNLGESTFNRRYIVAGDFNETTASAVAATAHFNGQPYHGMPISLNYLMSGILKKVATTSDGISVTNHPLPKRLTDNTNRVFFSTQGTGFTIAISVLFGMAFMATSFIIFLIKERSVGAKHLQVVSGVGPMAFWMSSFVWDIINYTIPVLCILIVFAAFQTDAYTNENRLGIVFLIFMLYGWSVLPFVYLLHYLFKTPATGMVVVSMINLLSGLVFLLATYTLSIPILDTENIGKALEWVFLITLPNYDLGLALMDMYTNAGYKDTCISYNYETICPIIQNAPAQNLSNPCCFPDYCGSTCFTFYDNMLHWEKPGVGREVLFMFIQGVVYMSLVLLVETGLVGRVYDMISKKATVASHADGPASTDSDVAQEADRINNTPIDNLLRTDSLVIKSVDKVYGSGFHAVKSVSVGVPKDECFGLLGQNGAGKTSTFKMLTGDEPLTSGHAYLSSYSVRKDIKQVQQNLGYCPQFDALIDQMTGRETLYMYARLRGVDESQIEEVVNKLIKVMMLEKHVDKQTGFYSGGNKRKLSTAIALIGDPPFIFLDEPTTGMDPGARRQLWNVLSGVRASGRTLILTSHSMEECDALCTRLVIMVNGRFVCLGSPQHLKNKFGHGYTLFCRMGLDEAGYVSSSAPLIEFVKQTFPNSQVFDNNQGYVDFQIPDENVKLGQIFGRMEQAKQQFNVEDYSVHQTTLEQIFLTFTQHQVAPKEQKKTRCCCFSC